MKFVTTIQCFILFIFMCFACIAEIFIFFIWFNTTCHTICCLFIKIIFMQGKYVCRKFTSTISVIYNVLMYIFSIRRNASICQNILHTGLGKPHIFYFFVGIYPIFVFYKNFIVILLVIPINHFFYSYIAQGCTHTAAVSAPKTMHLYRVLFIYPITKFHSATVPCYFSGGCIQYSGIRKFFIFFYIMDCEALFSCIYGAVPYIFTFYFKYSYRDVWIYCIYFTK
ncbi:pA224L [African swine fever virus]|uniref:PA224L n=1 Tax=African swine fever virus TaxID=10497 RepID=A0A8A1V6X6_ASF|nr:pA224L [African swine fever virus]